jgi:Mg2+ and Co2+ transporter CorA
MNRRQTRDSTDDIEQLTDLINRMQEMTDSIDEMNEMANSIHEVQQAILLTDVRGKIISFFCLNGRRGSDVTGQPSILLAALFPTFCSSFWL